MDEETIVALSSGALPSGVAVVRISGPASRAALLALAGAVPESRRASLRRIRDAAGATIDHGIVLFFEGPSTVTGEDLAEVHLHGGRAVVSACLAALTALPCVRLAEAGEFTRRAFENGRIDLTEAEGLADLLAAETEAQRRQALAQAGGALKLVYGAWRTGLVHARAMLEASFDFADEGDVGDDVSQGVRPALLSLAAEMRAHLGAARRGEILRHGYRVAIAGPPNAGKSSLLNALADRDAAIVSPVAGTTRDVIEVLVDLRGVPVRFLDTAGLRETDDPVETIGIARARDAMEGADLVLLLGEAGGPRDETVAGIHVKHFSRGDSKDDADRRAPALLRIGTKSDLPFPAGDRFGSETPDVLISARTGDGLPALIERIGGLAAEAAGDPERAVPARVRHREIVADVETMLRDLLAEDPPPEIAAETLRRATDRLGALTGRVGVEDLLGVIFSEFCIGK